ncbi:MAG: hypothetical protein ACM3IJ_03410 [Candidatus Levyibacteriota bacterium]
MAAAAEVSARRGLVEVIRPQHEEVWQILRDNIRLHFIRNTYNPLNLETYDMNAPALRPEDGIGGLGNAPMAVKFWEVFKAGGEGIKDHSMPGGPKFQNREVFSSRPYDIQFHEDRGDVAVKFLQYQKPDESLEHSTRMLYQGRSHDGWTGHEVKSIVTVHWLEGIGPVIEPTYRNRNNSFEEECIRAEQILADPAQKEEIDKFVAATRVEVGRIVKDTRRRKSHAKEHFTIIGPSHKAA